MHKCWPLNVHCMTLGSDISVPFSISVSFCCLTTLKDTVKYNCIWLFTFLRELLVRKLHFCPHDCKTARILAPVMFNQCSCVSCIINQRLIFHIVNRTFPRCIITSQHNTSHYSIFCGITHH